MSENLNGLLHPENISARNEWVYSQGLFAIWSW